MSACRGVAASEAILKGDGGAWSIVDLFTVNILPLLTSTPTTGHLTLSRRPWSVIRCQIRDSPPPPAIGPETRPGQGSVSISTTDCPTGRQTILPCYLSTAEWSVLSVKFLGLGNSETGQSLLFLGDPGVRSSHQSVCGW